MIRRHETLSPEPGQALARLLDVAPPGQQLPLLWHWLHLLERPTEADLGPDGHPASPEAVPAPPGPGRRRMWAGGTVVRHAPLRYGADATRETWADPPVVKQGRSGELTFVAVHHEIRQDGVLAVEEVQDIVYREPSATPHPPPTEQPAADAGDRRVRTSPTLLFRFSALTYNAHRIHYDRDYARDVEGYPGLVVHGPLQAVLMAERLREHGDPGPGRFGYRLLAPVFDAEDLLVAPARPDGDDQETGVRSGTGRESATGRWTGIAGFQ